MKQAKGVIEIASTYKERIGKAEGYALASQNMRGLSAEEVERSRAEHGDNKMSRNKGKSFARRFFENLGDPVIKILIGALIINVIFTFRDADWFETGGIAVSILLATFISTLSEHGSQAAFDRLSESSASFSCRVLRSRDIVELSIDEVVVGDLVLVGAGEQICADGILVSGELVTDQSAMTGESREVTKRAWSGNDELDLTPASPYYCLRGCTVLSGSGIMRIERVGDSTMLGGISREIQTETRESPLKIRLTKLARQISTLGYILAAVVALVYLFTTFVVDSAFDVEIIKYKLLSLDFLFSHLFHALTLGLTVIVVAVPEGLPMMIAVVLSSNIKKMVKDNVLVRKPVGIESAGSMNILFTDKTGTLTEGKLSVGEIYLGDGRSYKSLASLPSGAIYDELILGAFANTSSVVGRRDGARRALGGNSTDRAILECALACVREIPRFEVIKKTEFDSNRKLSMALVSSGETRKLLVKGAPEKILPRLSSYIDERGERHGMRGQVPESICRTLTASGKRVLAIALADKPEWSGSVERGELGSLTLLCLITLEDRIRAAAPASVSELRGAGIQVVMITGDNLDTAKHIAKGCGILDEKTHIAITGGELSRLTDAEVRDMLPHLAVVARALPNDKSRLVRISQELELVVGMTGDGINDAPALKRADVGFSMGSGTQVAKDAGDIIILDNDLASIVKAVRYGRNIFKSIRKFISLQLTMNLCAVGVSVICPFLGVEAPVTVVQMLWINIIMDTLGGLAFAGEPALESCMQERPKRRDEPILNGYMINEILISGAATVALCVAFFRIPEICAHYRWAEDNIYLLTAFFALFIFASVFNCFNARTDRLKLFSNIGKNKGFIGIMAAVLAIQIIFVYLGGAVLRTAPLTLSELGFTALLALLVFPADMLRKLIWRLLFGKKGY